MSMCNYRLAGNSNLYETFKTFKVVDPQLSVIRYWSEDEMDHLLGYKVGTRERNHDNLLIVRNIRGGGLTILDLLTIIVYKGY